MGVRTRTEHDKVLKTVLHRAKDYGITFNGEKCQFGVPEIEFYGYLFTGSGLKSSADKVRAVRESGPPTSKEDIKSFLGMVGYLSRFIPRYSSRVAPLQELTCKEERFRWGPKEKNPFKELKECITDETAVAYFNPHRCTVVCREASYNEGLSAVLFQETPKGIQPVHYISRTLSDTERRYSQTEKDDRAVKWIKDRFRLYLVGAPRFTIVTGHKPIVLLFNRPTARLPPWIEK